MWGASAPTLPQGHLLLVRTPGVDGVRGARRAHRHLPKDICGGEEVDEHDGGAPAQLSIFEAVSEITQLVLGINGSPKRYFHSTE